MANRQAMHYRQVTNVVAEKSGDLARAGAEIASKVMQQNQEALINDNLSKAQLELSQLQNIYQIENQSNPLGNIENYKTARKELLDKYGEGISVFYRRNWQNNVRHLSKQDDISQQAWVLKQTRQNTIGSINSSMQNNFMQANMDGQRFGKSSDAEIISFFNYDISRKKLEEFGFKNLGEQTTSQMLSSYETDYLKSFIMGVASTSPQKAMQFLDSDNVKGKLDSRTVNDLQSVVIRNAKKKDLRTLAIQSENENALTDMVLDPNGEYFAKRLQIDTMEMKGEITKDFAAQSRRVLTSQKNIDSVTNSDEMADIINQMYDLNSIADANSEDYLLGVRNVRQSILTKQASGKIDQNDAMRLNKQLRTLTAKKSADATQSVALGFYDANEMFQVLPPEYRGGATRELFYRSADQNFSSERYKAEATKIVEQLRSKIRMDAYSSIQKSKKMETTSIKGLVNPKTGKEVTMAEIQKAAKNRGKTAEEIIRLLRAKK